MSYSYLNQGQEPEAKAGGGGTAGTIASAAESAMQLYMAYRELTKPPESLGAVQNTGQMNLEPTATRFRR